MDIETPHGLARAHLHEVDEPGGALVLGHGAGGGVGAVDLVAATKAANACGWSVALIEQPYRVAGRKAPAPAAQLDVCFAAIVAALPFGELPLVTGGRSMGSRVACRTAAEVRAVGVICLAFPLVPPGNRPSRLPELKGAGVPILIVQGLSDSFGMPPRGPGRRLVKLEGDHGLKKDIPGLKKAVTTWLRER